MLRVIISDTHVTLYKGQMRIWYGTIAEWSQALGYCSHSARKTLETGADAPSDSA